VTPGPAPKDKAARRRRNVPAGGEWVDLPELERPVLPPLPDREPDWSEHSRSMWESWREDRATSQYTPADAVSALSSPWREPSLGHGVAMAMGYLPLAALTPVHLRGPQGVAPRLTVD
jgi:hypothetical protein